MKKTIIITGASSGIGKETALLFAQNDWNVAATMRNPENNSVFTDVQNIKLYLLDVTKPETIEKTINSVIKDFGSIDILVNNAGYGTDGVFEAMNDEIIHNQFDTNVFGLMRVTKAVLPQMRQQNGGTIIQISSVAGRITFPLFSIYHASKWAIEGFSESLQYELRAFNIRIKLIEPGVIKTDFYGRSRRFVTPENIPDYTNYAKKVTEKLQDTGKQGGDAKKIAKKIFCVAKSKSKRMRYPITYPSPHLIYLRKIIPQRWLSAIIRMQMKG